jgi:cytochrome c oxidase cbb3-type subunit 3
VLADDDWIWGGTLDDIETTIRYGIRSPHDDARVSDMPTFSDDMLDAAQISDVAQYVLSLNRREEDKTAAERGGEIFESECAGCHGENGEGGRDFGAPRLNDGIWLYSGERDGIVNQVTKPSHGVMPTWEGRLDDVSIKQVAIYVHSLGGGE